MIAVSLPHLAIVDLETFKKVQHRLDATRQRCRDKGVRGRTAGEAPLRKFLLSGLIVCPDCRLIMGVSTDRLGERRLRCMAASAKVRCENTASFPLRALDRCAIEAVRDCVKARQDPAFQDELRKSLDGQRARIQSRRSNLDERIAILDVQVEKMLNLLVDDDRTKDRLRARISTCEDEIDRLRLERNLTLSPDVVSEVENVAMTTLGDALDGLWDRSPFVATTPDEIVLKTTFRSLIRDVVPRRLDGGRFSVQVTLDVSGHLNGGEKPFERMFMLDSYKDDPGANARRADVAARLVESGALKCTDAEYALLVDLVPGLARHWPELKRGIVDAVVLSLSADVKIGRAYEACGVDFVDHGILVDKLRRSKEASQRFCRKLSELRPDAEAKLTGLFIAPRPTRHLRHRLQGHPFLDSTSALLPLAMGDEASATCSGMRCCTPCRAQSDRSEPLVCGGTSMPLHSWCARVDPGDPSRQST